MGYTGRACMRRKGKGTPAVLPISESWENVPDGVAVTVGNSSGNPGAVAPVGSVTQKIDGAKAVTFDLGVLNNNVQWTFPAVTRIVIDFYIRLTAYSTAATAPIIVQVELTAGTRAQVRLNNDGTLSLRNVFTAVGTTTATVPLNAWMRGRWTIDSTLGTQSLTMHTGANIYTNTADTGGTLTDLAYTTSNIDRVRVGLCVSPDVVTRPAHIDVVRATDVGVPPLLPSPGDTSGILIGSSADGVPGMSTTAQFDDYQTRYNGMAVTRIFSTGDIFSWASVPSYIAHVRANAPKMHIVYSYKTWNESLVTTWMTNKPVDGQTWWLCYHHEPINDVGITAADYKTRYKRLRELWVDAGQRSDIKLISIFASAPNSTYDLWWPGSTTYLGTTYVAVDAVTFDLYNPGYENQFYTVISASNWVGRHGNWATGKGVGWGITEMGAGVGPKWAAQSFTARRDWLRDSYLAYCKANGALMVICWDRPSLAKWSATDPAPDDVYYPAHGAINKIDYRMGLNAPLKNVAPSPNAGQDAYGGVDTLSEAFWRAECIASRALNNIPYP